MRVVTWKPGTDTFHDQLFESLREKHYRDTTHRLWKNYSSRSFVDCAALTIAFDSNNQPTHGASIIWKSCWPKGAYRIFNRLWLVGQRAARGNKLSPASAAIFNSQTEWLSKNTDCKLYFISREHNHWQQWVVHQFRLFDIDLSFNDCKYLTCNDRNNSKCWQRIVYGGDETILNLWETLKKKDHE